MRLGWEPPQFDLPLPVGGTYEAALVNSTPWPAGLVIDLHFTGAGAPITWTATIDGDTASWARTVAQVAAVVDAGNLAVSIRRTPSGGEPSIWYRGVARAV